MDNGIEEYLERLNKEDISPKETEFIMSDIKEFIEALKKSIKNTE